METILDYKNLIEAVIAREELKTQKLYELGYKKGKIKEFIDKKILIRIKRGTYQFNDPKLLHKYYRYLIRKKDYVKASACIHMAQKLDPSNVTFNFLCFVDEVVNRNYSEAFDYLKLFLTPANPNYYRDNLTYLYLLDQLMDLPKEYKDLLRGFRYENLVVLSIDQRYQDPAWENKLRKYIFKKAFRTAAKHINCAINDANKKIGFRELAINEMLYDICDFQRANDQKLAMLIAKKDYNEAISFLEELKLQGRTSRNQTYALKLLYKLVEITELQIIPEVADYGNKKFYRAIDANDFSNALYSVYYVSDNTNYLQALLTTIVDLIEKIKGKTESIKTSICKPSMDEVIKLLLNQEYGAAYTILKWYMYNLGNEKYFFLIKNLLRLSLLEHDLAFIKPMSVIIQIKYSTFVFSTTEYVRGFYSAISCSDINRAKIFLDIIRESRGLDDEICYIDELEKSLQELEQARKRKREF